MKRDKEENFASIKEAEELIKRGQEQKEEAEEEKHELLRMYADLELVDALKGSKHGIHAGDAIILDILRSDNEDVYELIKKIEAEPQVIIVAGERVRVYKGVIHVEALSLGDVPRDVNDLEIEGTEWAFEQADFVCKDKVVSVIDANDLFFDKLEENIYKPDQVRNVGDCDDAQYEIKHTIKDVYFFELARAEETKPESEAKRTRLE